MTNGLFGGCFGHFNMYHHLKRLCDLLYFTRPAAGTLYSGGEMAALR